MTMERLTRLFINTFGSTPDSVSVIAGSGSNRSYYRMKVGDETCIGVIGTDADENRAFVAESRHFHEVGLPVPQVISVSEDYNCYLQNDLGDNILYDMVALAHKGDGFGEGLVDLLCNTIAVLPKLQFEGAARFDFAVCYPEPEFSRQMVMFDLNYFKYCFLKPSGLEFNEVRLQDDLERFADDLIAASTLRDKDGRQYEGATFMYRDFQSRNVMICNGNPYFIDFQGGRKGPIYYDVASFVWHARSDYPTDVKKMMVDAYLESMKEYLAP